MRNTPMQTGFYGVLWTSLRQLLAAIIQRPPQVCTTSVLILREEGKFGESEALLCRAITIREKALGPDHADTAMSIEVLATVYGQLGRVSDCEPLARRALAIREKTLGPDHPATAYESEHPRSVAS